MENLETIFKNIEEVLKNEYEREFLIALISKKINITENHSLDEDIVNLLKRFLYKLIKDVDNMATIIKGNESILISVKNQKTLRTCFQIITSFGISNCLIPGLGLSLSKRCMTGKSIPKVELNDDQKYEVLVECTEFLHRSYTIPVLKNIILTFHLSDYLAALIQLAFAPLKKPGVYKNFTMTEDKFIKLNTDRQKFISIYEHLVNNCFQPILMKELLVLQNVKEIEPPAFVKRVIAKEMSRRLKAPGGLLSLIRCFIESHEIDVGVDWKKIDMICKIVCNKHGDVTEHEYLNIICNQLRQILNLNNTHYLTTAVCCLLSLSTKYSDSQIVKNLLQDTLQPFKYDSLIAQNDNPGTIIFTTQEVEHKISILHTCTFITKLDLPYEILVTNLFILFMLSIKCSNSGLQNKLNDIILKILELGDTVSIRDTINKLFSNNLYSGQVGVLAEEYNSGLILKCVSTPLNHNIEEISLLLVNLFQNSTNIKLTENIFECFLQLFLDVNTKRKNKSDREKLLTLEDEPIILSNDDEKYANIILILSEISATPKAINVIKSNPSITINFIEKLLSLESKENDECVTIALVLLNSVLSGSKNDNVKTQLTDMLPTLERISKSSDHSRILCKEILSQIKCEYPRKSETPYGKALSNVLDSLLPVRAHGIMELTKLIEAADPETISKRHYVFCLLQEQLKDSDSYVYLAAVNGIASLATHFTEDVLSLLCKEFLQISSKKVIETQEDQYKIAELRMKIGDIVVKVTRRLGEMAIVHKTELLNTFLCGCRDEDPLIRTSALSNLAEIALVLHYRVGTIIYEILLCIWSIIETDKAIECRRAAVMVISSLIKGLGRETLIELKENLLPIYKTLLKLYKDENEDDIVRLHAQISLEELNDIVKEFLFSAVPMEKQFCISNDSKDIKFK
ncbi:transport and Golgi organization protein 6 [Colias croceus]|uniref:transport and Golgi organization protein 6 n=1 Tax=Colias crocea TaxID=72248 RepID=UPI001E280DC6|nr:transport and Golgi organization protein 6 [Colias croceus]XP_045490801.1 transport and Golgi organization protein 6 [Colias croceus]